MDSRTHVIEVDAETAALVDRGASAQGVTASEFVSSLVRWNDAVGVPSHRDLGIQWAGIAAGAPTVPHEEVVRWLETWGTTTFQPFPR